MKNKKVKQMIETLVNDRCADDLVFRAKFNGNRGLCLDIWGAPTLERPFVEVVINGSGFKEKDWYYG